MAAMPTDAAVLQRQLDCVTEGNGGDRWVNRLRQSRNRQQPAGKRGDLDVSGERIELHPGTLDHGTPGFCSHPVLDTPMTAKTSYYCT